MIRLLTLFVLLSWSVASAATYVWTDASGAMHFTDDPDNVPPQYRKQMKVRETVDENRVTELPAEKSATGQGGKGASTGKGQMYGDHDEIWWRDAYQRLNSESRMLQEGLTRKNDELAVIHRRRMLFHKASDRTAYNQLKQEIEQDERRLQEVADELKRLDDSATRAGVPFDLRK